MALPPTIHAPLPCTPPTTHAPWYAHPLWHTHSLPCMPPCHAHPLPCMPTPTHTPLACTPPAMHVPMPLMSPCPHAPLPCTAPTHAPLLCTPPCHACPPPPTKHAPLQCMPPCHVQNHRHLWKHNLAATSFRPVKMSKTMQGFNLFNGLTCSFPRLCTKWTLQSSEHQLAIRTWGRCSWVIASKNLCRPQMNINLTCNTKYASSSVMEPLLSTSYFWKDAFISSISVLPWGSYIWWRTLHLEQ